MKYRTSYNETMYITHRNNVKHAIMAAEKEHYANLFDANRSNMKKTWNLLKGIINKKKQTKVQTRFKIDLNNIITNKSAISEKFNDFFCQHWTKSCFQNSRTNYISRGLSWT